MIYSVPKRSRECRAGEMLNLSPLCGGLPPEVAWPYLKRVGEVVLPRGSIREKDGIMTGARQTEAYYDPFDFDIDDDPYPTGRGCATKLLCTTTKSTTSTR